MMRFISKSWLVVVITLAAIFIFGLWAIAIPEELIVNIIQGSIKGDNITIEVTGIRKGFLYNFKCEQLALKKANNVLLSINNLSGRISLPSLFLLKVIISFKGDISGGNIEGEIEMSKGKNRVKINLSDVDISKMPFFAIAGIKGNGIMSGEFKLRDGIGDLRFSVLNSRLEGSFGGYALPLDVFRTVRGAMVINGNLIKIISFVMEGKDIYSRIKGDIKDNMLNFSMELMPTPSFTDRQILLLIDKYKVSHGYYVVPIKIPINIEDRLAPS